VAVAQRASVPVELVGVPEERLPHSAEVAAYYLVSEALTNVAKYAEASFATVAVSRDAGRVTIEVRDDGVGGADASAGSGLRGLSDRISALGGTLVVDSPPGTGTTVRAEIPL
jgi:signal transduction histidine kinase